jgi:hypothetical protein
MARIIGDYRENDENVTSNRFAVEPSARLPIANTTE